jgi:methylated-DNA-[protein]-cysteine S-methyltransferase
MPRHSAVIDTPLGDIRVSWEGDTLTSIDLEPTSGDAGGTVRLPKRLELEFEAYFRDSSHRVDLPLKLDGTPFQLLVWQALQAIPPGHTRTYGQLAKQLGTSPRAVGGACRANPCPIVVPCHRVVAFNGLGGFGGARSGRRLAVKRWLLQHEGVLGLE